LRIAGDQINQHLKEEEKKKLFFKMLKFLLVWGPALLIAAPIAVRCGDDAAESATNSDDAELFLAALSGWSDAEPVADRLAEFALSRRRVSTITPPGKVPATGKLDESVHGLLAPPPPPRYLVFILFFCIFPLSTLRVGFLRS
jgi:hypothetical protein